MDLARSIDEHIDFAANAEFGKINSRFNRETAAGEDSAGFVGFQVVDVRSVSVSFLADAVACAVNEVLAVTRFFDDVT